ncbi:MAG: hypothetical protein L6M37_03405 [Candidatus Methylarchaceae archaeon HK02M1]|nr:hypothetical protein [Candidatus Methylarchaceae archaeon HK02M1]
MDRKIRYTLSIAVIVLLLASFFIFIPMYLFPPGLLISEPNFLLRPDGRVIKIDVENRGLGAIELNRLFIDGTPILTWLPEKIILEKGEETSITISYHWLPEKIYNIDVYALPDTRGYIEAESPVIEPNITLQLGNCTVQEIDGVKIVSVPYEIESLANDWIHVILFTYQYYDKYPRPLYVFYDPVFMAPSSIERASAFTELALNYGISAQRINYTMLEAIGKVRPPAMIIFFDPLMDWLGKEVHDALPGVVLDPDEDGHVRDDSAYGKSLLYDWMYDDGLILVTIGSTQPHKYILYTDGRVNFNLDSFKWSDASFFLTSGGEESELFRGNFGIGDYTPTRITSSLGIERWWSLQAFDKDSMTNEGIEFYSYGDYNLPYQGDLYNLTLPAFIRVGDGGWLALGDDYNQMSDEKVIHDLMMILLHAPWDSIWIPYGWYWDNSAKFYQTQGAEFCVDGTLNTEGIPSHIIDRLTVRVLAIAYNSDYNEILIQEKFIYLS